MAATNNFVAKLISGFETTEDAGKKISDTYAATIQQLDELFKSGVVSYENDKKLYKIFEIIGTMDQPIAQKLYDWLLCHMIGYTKRYTSYLKAFMCLCGLGTKKNDTEAIAQFCRAFDCEEAHAMYQAGCIYAYSYIQDKKQAYAWFVKSAEMGFVPSKELAEIYANE